MLTYKLVHLIEYHSGNLAAGLARRVEKCDRAPYYHNVPTAELQETVREIYHHLGTWLLSKSESDVEQRYTAIGTRRAEQNIPLSELVWVIVLTKRNLWDFINDVSFPGRAVEVTEKQELFEMIDKFFDEAIHAAVVGHEWASQASTAPIAQEIVKGRKAS